MSENFDRTTPDRAPGGIFGSRYVRGLHTSATSNAAAYGYSVTITATFGVLSTTRGTPGVMQILAFVAGAVLAFAVVEAVASGGYRHEMEEEPSSIRALGSSISIFSVGGALGLAFAATWLVGGLVVWPLGSFLATVCYLLAFALEIAVADVVQRRVRRDAQSSKAACVRDVWLTSALGFRELGLRNRPKSLMSELSASPSIDSSLRR